MNYFIQRDDQHYGPYTLADLQRYAASGEISLTDLAFSDASPEPIPVGQIIGTIAVPPTFAAVHAPISFAELKPTPPNLHWGLVLLFTVITCGFFTPVWELVIAIWLQKYEPRCKSVFFYVPAILLLLVYYAMSLGAAKDSFEAQMASLVRIAYIVVGLVARFNLKNWLEEYYNSADPMGLQLSGVMVFFFGGIYFQYHVNDIARRKQADRLYESMR